MIKVDLTGRTAIVTGASRGIGRAISLTLAEAGAAVAGVDILEDKLNETMGECGAKGVRAAGFCCDIRNFEAVSAMVAGVLEKFGSIDILVNNAGMTRDNLLMRMTEKEWDDVLDTNLKGCFFLCKAACRPMLKARSGRIINIASIVGLMGNPAQGNYAASKAGMIGFTKSIARELAVKGVLANCIAPGFIETEMTGQLTEAQQERLCSMIPLQRRGTPQDVANAVLLLASDLMGYTTGQVINIDGGLVM